jgi:hypothetical protein
MAFAGGLATKPAGPAESPKLSRATLFAIEAILLVSIFAAFMHFGLCYLGDSKYSVLVSENLLYEHTFTVDPASVRIETPYTMGGSGRTALAKPFPYQMEMINGELFYFYPLGSSVLSLPIVALMNIAGYSAHTPFGRYNEDGDRQIQKVGAALLMAILTVVFFRTALLLLPLSWSLVLAIGAAFGTQIWSCASRVLWSHTWMILLFGIAIYMILSEEEHQARGHPVILATVLSWAYIVRPTSAIPIAIISLYILIFKPKEFIALAATGLAWLAAFIAVSWNSYGQLLPNYYLFHLSSGHAFQAIFGNLISPSRGLFVYTPGAAFALILVCYYRRRLSHRTMAILALIISGLQLLVISADPNWWGGHCYGARLTTDIVPWLFLLAVLGCRALLDEPRQALKHYAIAVGMLTIIVGAFMNGRGAMSQSANEWVNGPPDVDHVPSRVWDWSDPQFLAGLGRDAGH